MEMHNGEVLAFKVYLKAWDSDHHGSIERCDVASPQKDDDDDYGEDHMISKHDGLRHNMNLPTMMSPTMLSPPARCVTSQVC